MDQPLGNASKVPEMHSKVSGLSKEAKLWMADNPTKIRESVAVYLFLRREFEKHPVTKNHIFQFVYRSFYRMDNAGLPPKFHTAYFRMMQQARKNSDLDMKALASKLQGIRNLKNESSLQFSFVSKLAHTVNPNIYPIYDSEIARCFGFRPRYFKKYLGRLQQKLSFYQDLQALYEEIKGQGTLAEPVRLFRHRFGPAANKLPETKTIDLIFWSAGKRLGEIEKKNRRRSKSLHAPHSSLVARH